MSSEEKTEMLLNDEQLMMLKIDFNDLLNGMPWNETVPDDLKDFVFEFFKVGFVEGIESFTDTFNSKEATCSCGNMITIYRG